MYAAESKTKTVAQVTKYDHRRDQDVGSCLCFVTVTACLQDHSASSNHGWI